MTSTPAPLEVELNPDGYTIHLMRGPYGADLDPGDIPDLLPGARAGGGQGRSASRSTSPS